MKSEWFEDLVNTVPGTAVYRNVHTPEGISVWEYVSDGFEGLTGYPASLLMEDPAAIHWLVYEEDGPRFRAAIRRAIEERSSFTEVLRIKHKDGSIRWIRSRSRPHVDEDGTVVWHGTLVDETALHEAFDAKVRAEQALAASEERLRLAFDATNDGFWDWNPQTNEGTMSPRVLQMCGYDPAEVSSPIALWLSLVHPEDREEGLRIREEHFAGYLPTLDMVYRVQHKAGHCVYAHCRAKVVDRDEQGRPVRVVGTITDISKQKALEAELEKLAMVARESTNAVSIANRNGQVEWINEPGMRMTGFRVSALERLDLESLALATLPDEGMRKELLEHLTRGEKFAAETWLINKRDERIYASFEIKPVFDQRGEITAYLSVAQDMTARALAEEKLRSSEEHLRDAQEIAKLGSFRFIIDTGEVHWSEQLCRSMGRDPKDSILTAQEYFSQFDPKDLPILNAKVERALKEGIGYESQHHIRRFDGTEADFLARCKARCDATGRVIELYGTCQDVTDQVRAEKERLEIQERLASAQRFESLGLLAGGIAHDFNNLLMGVLMEESLLSRQVDPHTAIADGLENIHEAAKRMAELTSQLLSYAGRGQFVLEKLDPNVVVAEMLKLLRRNISQQASLESEISPGVPTLEIDGSQLRQVIMNLVINASEALEDKPGKITVRTRVIRKTSPPSLWSLEVTDSGAGMPDDVRKRIFDPFFTTKKSGRGLGLSTVQSILQRANGTIDVQSVPGQGTTFTVRLPLCQTISSEIRLATLKEQKPKALRILVADDEAMVRRSLRRMLELKNATVVEAADGVAALDALQHSPGAFDLVLLDVVMPRKNGYEVLAEIRQHYPGLRVVLMSGYNNPASISGAKSTDHQPDAAMQKPFDWNELERVMQSVQETRSTI